jgi:RecB family exonuclease
MLDERWASLDFGAAWYSRNERVRARDFLDRLVRWLHESRAELELIAIEAPFQVVIGEGADAVELRGLVDRLERDRTGALVIVDLKTGRSKVRDDDLPTHPQLGAYQLAIEHGAFAADGSIAGGARLVQLGAKAKQIEQDQPPLAGSDDPEWIQRELDYVAARMRGSQFSATVNGYCGNCDVAACCPLQPTGKQVTNE